MAVLLQVGGEDADEYKRTVRTRVKELVDRASEAQTGGAPEWLVVYVCPHSAGPASKAAGKARSSACGAPCGTLINVVSCRGRAFL